MIPATAHLTIMQAYLYDNLTSPITTIEFGNIAPNTTTTKTIWLRNTGDQNLTLSLTFTNVNPAYLFSYMTITWNREGVKIGPKSTLSADFTMNVLPNATLWPGTNGDIAYTLNIAGA